MEHRIHSVERNSSNPSNVSHCNHCANPRYEKDSLLSLLSKYAVSIILQVACCLRHISDASCAIDDLALTWTGPKHVVPGGVHEDGDGVNEVELVPGGAELAVNEANKFQFVEARTEHKLLGGCTEQVGSIMKVTSSSADLLVRPGFIGMNPLNRL